MEMEKFVRWRFGGEMFAIGIGACGARCDRAFARGARHIAPRSGTPLRTRGNPNSDRYARPPRPRSAAGPNPCRALNILVRAENHFRFRFQGKLDKPTSTTRSECTPEPSSHRENFRPRRSSKFILRIVRLFHAFIEERRFGPLRLRRFAQIMNDAVRPARDKKLRRQRRQPLRQLRRQN